MSGFPATRTKSKKNSFQSDIAYMMEAIGFDEALPETLDTMEDIIVSFLIDMFNEAIRSAELHGRPKVKLEDFKFAVRKDPNKLNRMDEINRNFKIIAKNKKSFESKPHQVKDLKQIAEDVGESALPVKGGKNSSRKGKKYKKRNKKLADDDEDQPPKKRGKLLKKQQKQLEQLEQEKQRKKAAGEDDDDDDDDDEDFMGFEDDEDEE